MEEKKNMVKGLLGFSIMILLLIFFIFKNASADLQAGTEGFRLSMPNLLAQAIILVLSYIRWYEKTNKEAANLSNLTKMRTIAKKQLRHFLGISLLLTGIVTAVTVCASVFGLLFIGIPAVYICGSSILMFLFGNTFLIGTMRLWGMPNRITGEY